MNTDDTEMRPGEVAVEAPEPTGPALHFIGRILTPFKTRADCPRQGDPDNGPECLVEVFDPWGPALEGLEDLSRLEVFYWLDKSRRDLVRQSPRHAKGAKGTFALRSPVRPNPIGLSRVRLLGIEGQVLRVRGLDCLNGTPLIDLKPDRCGDSR